MGVFVSSKSAVNRHGVFAIAQSGPTVLRAKGTGIVGYAAQFPWGPVQKVSQVYGPSDIKAMLQRYAPAGMPRTSSAYLGLIGLMPPGFKLVRVAASNAVAAEADLPNSGATDIVNVTAKYPGTAGNSITWEVKAASDGDSNHFDLIVSVTGSTGTTTESFRNLNVSGTGDDALPTSQQLEQVTLVGSITKLAAGRPANGTGSLAGGTSPAVVSGDYVGTAGTGDKGFALLEAHTDIRQFATDDCGNSLRAAVNAGGFAHALFMGNRLYYANGDSGTSAVDDVKSDVENNRSVWGSYVDPWYWKRDDIDGSQHLVPPGLLAAKVAATTSPSTSIAWKDPEQVAKLGEVVSAEFDRGAAAGTNTDNGVITIIREENGGHSFEADVLTIAPMDEAKKRGTRQRMGIYIATAFVEGNRRNVDAPNVEVVQDDEMTSLDTLLAGLVKNKKRDPQHSPFINGYTLQPVAVANTPDDIQSGDFNVAADVQTGAPQERIFLLFNWGEKVKVSIV